MLVPVSVREVVESAEESVKPPLTKVMAPVEAFAVRLGLKVLLAVANVARLEVVLPGPEPFDQLVPLLHVVLLLEVHVAFWPKAAGMAQTVARIPVRRKRRMLFVFIGFRVEVEGLG